MRKSRMQLILEQCGQLFYSLSQFASPDCTEGDKKRIEKEVEVILEQIEYFMKDD